MARKVNARRPIVGTKNPTLRVHCVFDPTDKHMPGLASVEIRNEDTQDFVCDFVVTAGKGWVKATSSNAKEGTTLANCRASLKMPEVQKSMTNCLAALRFPADRLRLPKFGEETQPKKKKKKKADPHEGMIYNPVTDTWSWF